jgi:hypothetical protein
MVRALVGLTPFNEDLAMTHTKLFGLPLLGLATLTLSVAAYADDSKGDKLVPYKLLTTIAMPDLTGFDISWADSEGARYYLADRGNATAGIPPRIDVIDTRHNKFLYAVNGFAGPNGVVAIHAAGDDDEQDQANSGELWVGDADSTVKVVDLRTRSIVATIPVGGTGRSDELAYDPLDQILLVANDRDNPPFVTFISTKTRTVLGKLSYPQAVFGTPTPINHGLEQPVWDGQKRRFYLAVPATSGNPNGEVDEINPLTRTVTNVFPTSCNPAGLALIPGQRLMTSCGDVVAISTGSVVKTVTPKVGGDEIWFNPGDERVYFGGGTNFISVDVVDALDYSNITTLTVGLLVAPGFNPANHITHSVAADSELNRIFVPVSHEGVKVYTDDRDNGEGNEH